MPSLEYNRKRNIAYRENSDSLGELARLDLFYPTENGNRRKPVVVYVHGGGWIAGDKAEICQNEALLEFLVGLGCLVAAVNFRPLKDLTVPGATYRDQASDIAAALKWLVANVEAHGGSSSDFTLVGYSSGAHLASLAALDGTYLSMQGLAPDLVRAVVALDVHAYDIPAALSAMEDTPLQSNIPLMKLLFGESPAEQLAASPINYVGCPSERVFLLFSSGLKGRIPQSVSRDLSDSFRKSLIENGHWAAHMHLPERNHRAMLGEFGRKRDRVAMTLREFLEIVWAQRESASDAPRDSLEFKLGAVLRAESPEKSAATNLTLKSDVRMNDLYAWRKQFRRHLELLALLGEGRVSPAASDMAGGKSGDQDSSPEDSRKQAALALMESGKRPVIAIARELGVPVDVLYRWKKEGRLR